MWVNVVLSCDNALVIALAARALPERQQKRAVQWGAGAAVVIRVALTIAALGLLMLPYLKLIGAAVLIWIAVDLLVPAGEVGEGMESSSSLIGAIKSIVIADLVMSVDNVLAVAAAAKGDMLVLICGLALSIPVVIFGATLLVKLMERHPMIVTIGAAVIGWVAGETAVTDPSVGSWVDEHAAWLYEVGPAVGAALVVAVGKWLARRREDEARTVHPMDLAVDVRQRSAGRHGRS